MLAKGLAEIYKLASDKFKINWKKKLAFIENLWDECKKYNFNL